MNKLLVKYLLPLFCLLFQIVPLFGGQKQCGKTLTGEQAPEELTKVVNDSFQASVPNASQFLVDVFKAFNKVKLISSEKVNLLFYKGNLYINRHPRV